MRDTRYSYIVDLLERSYNSALMDAANYADGGSDTESVYADGYAAGIKYALDVIADSDRRHDTLII